MKPNNPKNWCVWAITDTGTARIWERVATFYNTGWTGAKREARHRFPEIGDNPDWKLLPEEKALGGKNAT
jgi:hypothetical protein